MPSTATSMSLLTQEPLPKIRKVDLSDSIQDEITSKKVVQNSTDGETIELRLLRNRMNEMEDSLLDVQRQISKRHILFNVSYHFNFSKIWLHINSYLNLRTKAAHSDYWK